MKETIIFFYGLFVLAASCYVIFILSGPLKKVGGRIGKLLHLPEDVIASTFQALATSGPEIVMAILAATPFITYETWKALELGEKAGSGTLNIIFSAMSNLLGIGAVAIIFMIKKGMVKKDDIIEVKPSVKISLIFYVLSSTLLFVFVMNKELGVIESWVLMIIGIVYVFSQFFIPGIIKKFNNKTDINSEKNNKEDIETENGDKYIVPSTAVSWIKDFSYNSFIYVFLIIGLVIFVREAMGASFRMAIVSMFSLGGVIIMFTSYISSFPEFMLTYRYIIANKKSALLGMLFGSNVIDLAFSGFRAIWIGNPMQIYSTGPYGNLLIFYIMVIPVIAILALIGLCMKKIKFKIAYPLVIFYIFYIISGFILI